VSGVHLRTVRVLAVCVVALFAFALFAPTVSVRAAGAPGTPRAHNLASAPPASTPVPPPSDPPAGEPNPITQIINNIIQFPFKNLTDALWNAFKSMLEGAVAPMEDFFADALNQWVVVSPTIIGSAAGHAAGGGPAPAPPAGSSGWLGEASMQPAWDVMVRVSVFFWPLVLAIIAVIAAKDAVSAASWGIGDLKSVLAQWFVAVLLGATSIYWIDWINRLSNGVGDAIASGNFIGRYDIGRALAQMICSAPLTWLAALIGGAPLLMFLVLFVVILGLTLLASLIFQMIARYVILYILVVLAPVVLILSVLPPLQWLRFMWFKGLVLVEMLGPINLLMLQLAVALAVHSSDAGNPIGGFVNLMGSLGVLSILITIDGVIIKGVFGAVGEIAQKAAGTVAAVATMALAAVSAGVLGGAGALGSASTGAGAGAGAGGGSGGLGGVGDAASSAAGGASLGAGALSASGNGGAGSPASIARSAFNGGAALRAAGGVLSRQGGIMGGVGAGMQAVGGTLEQRDRDAQRQPIGASASQPNAANAGGASASQPNAANAGGASASPANAANAGGASASQPNAASAGDVSASQPNATSAGGAPVSQPNAASAGGASASPANAASAGGASASPANAASAGGVSASQPNTATTGGASASPTKAASASGAPISQPNAASASGAPVSQPNAASASGASASPANAANPTGNASPPASPAPAPPSPQLFPGGSAYAGNLTSNPNNPAKPVKFDDPPTPASQPIVEPIAATNTPPVQVPSQSPMGTAYTPQNFPVYARGEQEVAAAAQALPPVPDGHVRLFRGVDNYDSARETRAPYSDAEMQRVGDLVSRRVQGHPLTPEEGAFVKGAMNNDVRFYSDNPAVAAQAAGANGAVLYVDMPRNQAAQFQNMQSAATFQNGQGMSYNLPHAFYQLGRALFNKRS